MILIKCQNNCSRISRWTLSEAARLFLILHQPCFSLKFDHQDLLRSVCLLSLNYLHLIFWGALFLDHYMYIWYYWRYRAMTDIYAVLLKDFIDLHNRNISICTNHILFIKCSCFISSIFSLYQIIIAWLSKIILNNKKHMQTLFFSFSRFNKLLLKHKECFSWILGLVEHRKNHMRNIAKVEIT